jgi:cytochrome P450
VTVTPDDLVLVGDARAVQRRLDEARAGAPIVRSASHRAWVVLRHADVVDGFRDPRLSSDRMDAFERLARTRPDGFRTVVDLLSGWMVFRDPPAHTRLRQPVKAAFTPRRLAALETTVQTLVDGLLDDVSQQGGGDLHALVARPLPAMVIARLLGVPDADRHRFQQWSDELAGIVFAASSRETRDTAAIAGAQSFTAYFGELVDRYRAQPADNLISAIVAAADRDTSERGAIRLTPEETVGACAMLLFAGHETTTGFLTNALWTVFDHPGELDRWRHDRALDAPAVEELMRVAGPAGVMIRRARETFAWQGVTIRAGDAVFLCMAAANHDPDVFTDPDVLDLSRDPNPHLGFGWGLHHCLGAPLARLESRVALRTILDRFPNLRPVGGPQWTSSVLGRGSGPLPVRL